MANKQINARQGEAVVQKTVSSEFFMANHHGQKLFSVVGGVPVEDALSWASCFLDTVINLLNGGEWDAKAEAACNLVQLAKAVIDSVEGGGCHE